MHSEPQSPKAEDHVSRDSKEDLLARGGESEAEASLMPALECLPDELPIATLRQAYAALARETTILRAELAQRRIDETRFRSFFDLPLTGMAVTSPEARFLDVNEKLAQILGHFTTTFRKRTSKTPKEFRNAAQLRESFS